MQQKGSFNPQQQHESGTAAANSNDRQLSHYNIVYRKKICLPHVMRPFITIL